MRKVLLCILDGWGLGKKNKHNAIQLAIKNKVRIINEIDIVVAQSD